MSFSIVGKTCPYCQTVIKPDTPVVVCPECGMPHHEDCWGENGGCTTFGCPGRDVPVPSMPAPSLPPPAHQRLPAGSRPRSRRIYTQWPQTRNDSTAPEEGDPLPPETRRSKQNIPQLLGGIIFLSYLSYLMYDTLQDSIRDDRLTLFLTWLDLALV